MGTNYNGPQKNKYAIVKDAASSIHYLIIQGVLR
jgi:hypothetical protein